MPPFKEGSKAETNTKPNPEGGSGDNGRRGFLRSALGVAVAGVVVKKGYDLINNKETKTPSNQYSAEQMKEVEEFDRSVSAHKTYVESIKAIQVLEGLSQKDIQKLTDLTDPSRTVLMKDTTALGGFVLAGAGYVAGKKLIDAEQLVKGEEVAMTALAGSIGLMATDVLTKPSFSSITKNDQVVNAFVWKMLENNQQINTESVSQFMQQLITIKDSCEKYESLFQKRMIELKGKYGNDPEMLVMMQHIGE